MAPTLATSSIEVLAGLVDRVTFHNSERRSRWRFRIADAIMVAVSTSRLAVFDIMTSPFKAVAIAAAPQLRGGVKYGMILIGTSYHAERHITSALLGRRTIRLDSRQPSGAAPSKSRTSSRVSSSSSRR
jgi:hypothetical protein